MKEGNWKQESESKNPYVPHDSRQLMDWGGDDHDDDRGG